MAMIDTILSKERIEKGWSGDQKYCVKTADGTKLLLRISSLNRFENRRTLFEIQKQVAALDLPICRPIEFGVCDDGVYSLQSFIDGQDAEILIPNLPTGKQYAYGRDAGRILKKMHSLPAPSSQEDWSVRFHRKIDRKVENYLNCPIRYENGKAFLSYIDENRYLLQNVPQSFQHGDYHIGNMMVDRNGTLTIIDFDRYDFGDPWEEFNRISWCAQCSEPFASGLVDGYFDGTPPELFWRMLALYISCNTVSSLPWAIPFGEKEVATMRRQAHIILTWYDGMRSIIPSWYHGSIERS